MLWLCCRSMVRLVVFSWRGGLARPFTILCPATVCLTRGHFFQNELVRVLIACLAASGLPSNCLLSSALRRRRYLATDRGMRLRIPLSDLDFIDNLFDTLNARLDGIRQTGETRSRSSGHENQPDESYRFIHPAPASPAGRGGVWWQAHPTVSNHIEVFYSSDSRPSKPQKVS